MASSLPVTTRNARFQQWQALLARRSKRQARGEFMVQGARPITVAVERRADIRALLHRPGRLSRWAEDVLGAVSCPRFELAPELLDELGEKDGQVPELLAVAAMPADDLERLPAALTRPVVVLDRPASPGNLGTVVRAGDALGAQGVIVSGHAADPYDPRAVRASTGSIFALPVVRVPDHHAVLAWADTLGLIGPRVKVIATDEKGQHLAGCDLTGPCLVLVGNEGRGLSRAWLAAADVVARIPMTGSASSLNAAMAATVVLYEASRQRERLPQ